MTELKRVRNEFLMFVGLTVIVLVLGGGIVWAVYSVIGELTDPGRHWLATGLVFAVPIAYALGLQSAKAHRKGIERGIDLKLGGEGFALAFWLGTVIAMTGKMLGTLLPARLAGETWRDGLRLGTLMQCKGLMDVVVLSVLLDAGVLAPVAFSALVLMAVATTTATKPMLLLIGRMWQTQEHS